MFADNVGSVEENTIRDRYILRKAFEQCGVEIGRPKPQLFDVRFGRRQVHNRAMSWNRSTIVSKSLYDQC